MKEKILIHYFNEEYPKLKSIENGDWVDLYTAGEVILHKNSFMLIPLGVSMKLPEGYEAIVAPRSSTFKNFGIIMTNSIGVIDESYSGTNDQWRFPAYATRDIVIPIYTRICQFRIIKHQPAISFEVVEELDEKDRGGFGTTGTGVIG